MGQGKKLNGRGNRIDIDIDIDMFTLLIPHWEMLQQWLAGYQGVAHG